MAAVCAKCRIIGAQENGDGDLCLKGAPGTFLAARGCRILHIWEGESVGMEHREKGRVPWNSEAMTCKCKMWWISGWAEALSTRLHSVWFLESTQDWDDRFGYKNCILSSLHFRNRVEKSPQTSIFGKCATVKTPGEVWLIQEKTKRYNCFSVIVEVIWGKNINAGNIFSEFLRFKIIFIVWFIGWILLYDGYDGFILMDKLRGLQIPPREIDDRKISCQYSHEQSLGDEDRQNEAGRAVGLRNSFLSSEGWVERSREIQMCSGKSLQLKGDVTWQNLSVCNNSRIKIQDCFGAWRGHLLMWTYLAKSSLEILKIKVSEHSLCFLV